MTKNKVKRIRKITKWNDPDTESDYYKKFGEDIALHTYDN